MFLRYEKSQQVFGLDTAHNRFCYSFVALLMTRYLKSAQKSAVHVCLQVATVVKP